MTNAVKLSKQLNGLEVKFVTFLNQINIDSAFNFLAPIDKAFEEWLRRLNFLLVLLKKTNLDKLIGNRHNFKSNLTVILQ